MGTAPRSLGIREEFVGNAHLDVVSLSGEDLQRFVLGFPSESRDGAIVAAGVGVPGNPQLLLEGGVRVHIGEGRSIRNVFDQSRAIQRRRNAKDQIAKLVHHLEIGLREGAVSCVRTAANREERACTPPSRAPLKVPLALTKNGKRASRTGPSAAMKKGILF